jgi:hypothetical protein
VSPVEQVARVTRAFTDAGIMVHAYLMYGFPDRDRAGHRRCARARAPVVRRGLHPVGLLASLLGDGALAHRTASGEVRHHALAAGEHPFAHNDLEFHDPRARTTTTSGAGLRKALYNYMHGIGLDADVREWFEPRANGGNGSRKAGARRAVKRVPRTTVPADPHRAQPRLTC